MRRTVVGAAGTIAAISAIMLVGHAVPGETPPNGDLPPIDRSLVIEGHSVSLKCVACHGAKGSTDNPTFPIIAGQHAGYLAEQLHHFRSGKRYNGMMTPIAQTLTDEEISAVAAYFSTIEEPAEENRRREERDY